MKIWPGPASADAPPTPGRGAGQREEVEVLVQVLPVVRRRAEPLGRDLGARRVEEAAAGVDHVVAPIEVERAEQPAQVPLDLELRHGRIVRPDAEVLLLKVVPVGQLHAPETDALVEGEILRALLGVQPRLGNLALPFVADVEVGLERLAEDAAAAQVDASHAIGRVHAARNARGDAAAEEPAPGQVRDDAGIDAAPLRARRGTGYGSNSWKPYCRRYFGSRSTEIVASITPDCRWPAGAGRNVVSMDT